MKRMLSLCAAALCLTLALTPTALAADFEPAVPDAKVCYPTSIVRNDDGTELKKIYDLSPEDDPAGIPRSDFRQDGFQYTLTDLLKQELPENESRQHITVQTSGGATFYIVIDYDKPVDEDGEQYQTYFLNTVDEADLLAAAEAAGVELASCSCSDKCAAGAVNTDCAVCAVNMTECAGVEQKPEPEPEPVAEPDAEPETEKGNAGMLLLVLAVAVLGGGAAFYFKVYRPKQQAATEPEEDYGEELEDYDGEEDGPPWDEDEDENEDTEDGE